MKKDVILIFDIGKTNKKVLLFDSQLKIVFEEEKKFPEIMDDDGFPCDDIEKLEGWIIATLQKHLDSSVYQVLAVNFTTYGATLMYTDKEGKRLTPIYNYLKPIDSNLTQDFYERYGGIEEFSRKTASPSLGMLNSGIQILWLKKNKAHIFEKIRNITHFPQYLSFLLSGEVSTEHTSIGCHTAMWDFDNMSYHKWIESENINLPEPVSVQKTFPANIGNKELMIGVGMHDSSASLVPYLMESKKKFILVSTGTWCISMNPFNHNPLTADQLKNDCLSFLSIEQKPVKSSRFFLGYIHDINLKELINHFGVKEDRHKNIEINEDKIESLIKQSREENLFFKNGVPDDYLDRSLNLTIFSDFEEAYYQLMIDLTKLVIKSIQLIIPEEDNTDYIYISGGFVKNEIFTRLLAGFYTDKEVYISEVANATSLGAALVLRDQFYKTIDPTVNLGLEKIESFKGSPINQLIGVGDRPNFII